MYAGDSRAIAIDSRYLYRYSVGESGAYVYML